MARERHSNGGKKICYVMNIIIIVPAVRMRRKYNMYT